MNKHPNWKPATITAPKPDTDPRAKAIDFTLTPAERDIAVLARIEVLAAQRGPFVPGLVVKHLQPSDLTESERRAFGIIGGEA